MVVNQQYVGYMVIADEIKENSKAAIAKLKQHGVSKVVMLTGDHEGVAKKVAAELERSKSLSLPIRVITSSKS